MVIILCPCCCHLISLTPFSCHLISLTPFSSHLISLTPFSCCSVTYFIISCSTIRNETRAHLCPGHFTFKCEFHQVLMQTFDCEKSRHTKYFTTSKSHMSGLKQTMQSYSRRTLQHCINLHLLSMIESCDLKKST